MSRILRPTSMRAFRPFNGAGGEFRSIAGGGGGGGSTATEDWESESVGVTLTGGDDWILEDDKADYEIIAQDAYAPMPSQHLKTKVTTTGNSISTHTPSGTSNLDGKVSMEFCIGSDSGSTNNSPTLVARFQNTANQVHGRFGRQGTMIIYTFAAGTPTGFSTSYVLSNDTLYYGEMELSGSTITLRLFLSSDRTTELASVTTSSSTHNETGKMGMAAIGAANLAYAHFDNWNWEPA